MNFRHHDLTHFDELTVRDIISMLNFANAMLFDDSLQWKDRYPNPTEAQREYIEYLKSIRREHPMTFFDYERKDDAPLDEETPIQLKDAEASTIVVSEDGEDLDVYYRYASSSIIVG